uniref:Uncharacterized protein n=1 Tax=Eptatretus burgeri TaxID=7764 RepID=A0A8C4Q9G1_EPTBU
MGVPGRAGEDGVPGRKGFEGSPGYRGPKGELGLHGPPGRPMPGKKGKKGERGEQSHFRLEVKGQAGPSGDKGYIGNPGWKGTKGEQGYRGPAAISGFPGEKGSTGPKGEQVSHVYIQMIPEAHEAGSGVVGLVRVQSQPQQKSSFNYISLCWRSKSGTGSLEVSTLPAAIPPVFVIFQFLR